VLPAACSDRMRDRYRYVYHFSPLILVIEPDNASASLPHPSSDRIQRYVGVGTKLLENAIAITPIAITLTRRKTGFDVLGSGRMSEFACSDFATREVLM
jgi:hypothetical protein